MGELLATLEQGLEGRTKHETLATLTAIEARLRKIAGTGKLYGRDFDDLVALKYLHQRYTAYLRWLEQGA